MILKISQLRLICSACGLGVYILCSRYVSNNWNVRISWNTDSFKINKKILDDSTMVFDRDKKEDRLFCLTRYFSSNGFWWSFLLAIYCHQIFANVLENETSNISKSISLDISHWLIPDKFNMLIFVRKLKSWYT